MPKAGVVVHLVSMPWSAFTMPSVQLGVLKASLDTDLGVRARVHTYSAFFTIPFMLGGIEFLRRASQHLTDLHYSYYPLYTEQLSARRDSAGPQISEKTVRSMFPDWIDHHALVDATTRYFEERICPRIDTECWNIIGFTLPMYSQLYATLYGATYLEHRFPDSKLLFVFGGDSANCRRTQDVLGNAGLEGFIALGEGERTLTGLAESCLESSTLEDITRAPMFPRAGMLDLDTAATSSSDEPREETPQVDDLDLLPNPDYGEFFSSLRECLDGNYHSYVLDNIWLPVEGSRGCKFRCSFCNDARSWSGRRVKSAERIADEIVEQSATWDTNKVIFVDSSCDDWATSFARQIAGRGVSLTLTMETRANHPLEFWVNVALSGANDVELGIESLSTPLLKTMRKGIRAIDNLRALKYLKELGIRSWSNLITHFPGSAESDIAETQRILQLIPHLDPLGLSTFKLVSGSYLFERLPRAQQASIAHTHPSTIPPYLANELVSPAFSLPKELALTPATSRAWDRFTDWYSSQTKRAEQQQPELRIMAHVPGKRIDLQDSRFGEPHVVMLFDEQAALYDLCHSGETFPELARCSGLGEAALTTALDDLLDDGYLVRVDDHYLSLALRARDVLLRQGSSSLNADTAQPADARAPAPSTSPANLTA